MVDKFSVNAYKAKEIAHRIEQISFSKIVVGSLSVFALTTTG
jgi:hypothetical protein